MLITSWEAALHLDFANTFPSLFDDWLFAVLAAMGLPGKLYVRVPLVVCTCDLALVRVAHCPAPFFALTLDPFIRWYLPRPVFASTTIFCCTDDIAIVADHDLLVLP